MMRIETRETEDDGQQVCILTEKERAALELCKKWMYINIMCGKEAIMYTFLVFFLAFCFELEGGREVKKAR